MTDFTIICLSLSRHDSAISSPALSLAKEFARNNRVFYIDHPFSWKDFISEYSTQAVQTRKKALLGGSNPYIQPAGFPERLTVVTAPLTLPVNFLPESLLYRKLSAINDRILFRLIRKIIQEHKLRRFIFINFFDPFFCRGFPDDIRPLLSVYQSMDDIAEVSYTRKHGMRLEKEIIRSSDFTLCTSRQLTRMHGASSPHVHYHPNGAATELFEQALDPKLEVPGELNGIVQSIIGFTGSIDYRSDGLLLEALVRHFSEAIICFVGPVLDHELAARLKKYPNVLFTGPRKLEELPAYLKSFSCTIIPYACNKLTSSIYPLKINEYLAAGKPVVSTRFSEDIENFSPVIYLAASHAEFIALTEKAISDDNKDLQQIRTAFARKNNWQNRVEAFWEIARQYLPPDDTVDA